MREPFARLGVLLRAFLRRDRWLLGWWILGIWLLYLSQAWSVEGLYQTPDELADAAAAAADNTAFIAMAGPARALDTVGGQVAWQAAAFGAIAAGLMSMFIVGRHTRAEEESGRDELVRAAAVGRYAPLGAAAVEVASANVAVGAAVAIGLMSNGLPVPGSLALGAALALTGLVFAGVALVAAQLTSTARSMYGITGAVIGLSYVLRAVGDIGNGGVSWLSPIGWGQYLRAYADEQWWPMLLPIVVTPALVVVAAFVYDRRNLGQGVWSARPGPPGGRTDEWVLAWRQQRVTLLAWSVGLFLTGLSFGSVGDSAADLMGDSEFSRDVFGRGATITEGFYAAVLLMQALMAAGYAISAALRPASEEDHQRVELLVSTTLPRGRWAMTHGVIAVAGTLLVVALGGLGVGVASALATDDGSQVATMTGASLTYVPAVLTLAALAWLAWGVRPQWRAAAWASLAFCVTVMLFAETLRFPGWVIDVSPFAALPAVPMTGPDPAAMTVITLVAVTFALVGQTAWHRRDIR